MVARVLLDVPVSPVGSVIVMIVIQWIVGVLGVEVWIRKITFWSGNDHTL
jgi:hypothetical protein